MMKRKMNVILVLLPFLWGVSVADEMCTQTGPCTCVGPQGRIDLSPLGRSDFLPRFRDTRVAANSEFYYSYNPCLAFTEGACSSVAVCQTDLGAQFYSLGSQDSAKFVYDASSKLNQICYSHLSPDGVNRSACVTLKCDHSVEGQFDVQGVVNKSNSYRMTLTSVYACANDTTTPGPTHSTPSHSPTLSTTATPTTTPPANSDVRSIRDLVVVLATVAVLQLCLAAATLAVLVRRRGSYQVDEKSGLLN